MFDMVLVQRYLAGAILEGAEPTVTEPTTVLREMEQMLLFQ